MSVVTHVKNQIEGDVKIIIIIMTKSYVQVAGSQAPTKSERESAEGRGREGGVGWLAC